MASKQTKVLPPALLVICSIVHADTLPQVETAVISTTGKGSLETETPKLDDEPDESWLGLGISAGFGASYVLLGPKIYLETPVVRLFGTIGLGVGVGVDVKLSQHIDAGFTRAISLGGGGWDVMALRYHQIGAFEKGWFIGVEHIGNRTYPRDDNPDGTEREWLVTFGYDF